MKGSSQHAEEAHAYAFFLRLIHRHSLTLGQRFEALQVNFANRVAAPRCTVDPPFRGAFGVFEDAWTPLPDRAFWYIAALSYMPRAALHRVATFLFVEAARAGLSDKPSSDRTHEAVRALDADGVCDALRLFVGSSADHAEALASAMTNFF
jgi:hypothetical protein